MQKITKLLSDLNKTSKRTEKIALVREFAGTANDAELMLVHDALDPLFITGVRKCPFKGTAQETTDDTADVYVLFGKIANESGTLKKEALLQDVFSRLTEEDGETFRRLVTKDLGGGLGISTWNSGCPSLKIREYPCLLVSAYSEKLLTKLLADAPLICQEKCDGMRFNAIVQGGHVELFGRSGKPITVHESAPLVQAFASLPDGVFDGELLCVQGQTILDRKTGNGILNKAVRGTITPEESNTIVARVWDFIELDDFRNGISDQTYFRRFERLGSMIPPDDPTIQTVKTWFVTTKDEILEHFNEINRAGGEGVIVKARTMVWKDTRSTQAVKLKAELDCDLKIVAVNPSKEGGKYEGLMGAIVCESADGKVRVGVGTGFSDEDRRWFMENKDRVIGKIVSVCYNMRVRDKNRPDVDSLFLPRYVELREDKEVADGSDTIK